MSQDRKSIDLLRYAVRLFDNCNETFNQKYSDQELLKIATAHQKTEWDYYPDQWAPRQLQELLNLGKDPKFDDNGNPSY